MNKETSDHTDLAHANLIKDLMPKRELRVGDRVWDEENKQYGYVIEIPEPNLGRKWVKTLLKSGMVIVYMFSHKVLTRLFTFSEIWAELPEMIDDHELGVSKLGSETYIYYLDLIDIPYTTIPANCAAALLAWVREEKI